MFGSADNYEERKVARYDDDGVFVSTARVSDGEKPYETAVGHPDYNSHKLVVVEAYTTEAQARTGHERWIRTMTAEPERLPELLVDCQNSFIAKLLKKPEDLRFPRAKKAH